MDGRRAAAESAGRALLGCRSGYNLRLSLPTSRRATPALSHYGRFNLNVHVSIHSIKIFQYLSQHCSFPKRKYKRNVLTYCFFRNTYFIETRATSGDLQNRTTLSIPKFVLDCITWTVFSSALSPSAVGRSINALCHDKVNIAACWSAMFFTENYIRPKIRFRNNKVIMLSLNGDVLDWRSDPFE